jgi:hypothetical protein
MVGSDHGLVGKGRCLDVEHNPNSPQVMGLESSDMFCGFQSLKRVASGKPPADSGARGGLKRSAHLFLL